MHRPDIINNENHPSDVEKLNQLKNKLSDLYSLLFSEDRDGNDEECEKLQEKIIKLYEENAEFLKDMFSKIPINTLEVFNIGKPNFLDSPEVLDIKYQIFNIKQNKAKIVNMLCSNNEEARELILNVIKKILESSGANNKAIKLCIEIILKAIEQNNENFCEIVEMLSSLLFYMRKEELKKHKEEYDKVVTKIFKKENKLAEFLKDDDEEISKITLLFLSTTIEKDYPENLYMPFINKNFSKILQETLKQNFYRGVYFLFSKFYLLNQENKNIFLNEIKSTVENSERLLSFTLMINMLFYQNDRQNFQKIMKAKMKKLLGENLFSKLGEETINDLIMGWESISDSCVFEEDGGTKNFSILYARTILDNIEEIKKIGDEKFENPEQSGVDLIKKLSDPSKFGIVNFKRYPIDILRNMYENLDNSGKPWIGIVAPYSDWNGAFQDSSFISDLYNHYKGTHTFRIFEDGNVFNLTKNLLRAEKKYGLGDEGYLMGHGQSRSITFGTIYNRNYKLEADIIEKLKQREEKFIKTGGKLFFISCSTGKDEEGKQSVSKAISKKFNLYTIAPDSPANIKSYNPESGTMSYSHDAGSVENIFGKTK